VEVGMKRSDKYLAAIAIGVVLLVGISLVIVATRPKPSYQPENSPEAVVHNYLLAVVQEDYERAYGYLSHQIPGYPRTVQEFSRDIHDYSWVFRTNSNTDLAVEGSRTEGQRAAVTVRETRFYQGDLFYSNQRIDTFDVELELENGIWKITYSNYYFVACWTRENGCR
jgi:hypothetical protein